MCSLQICLFCAFLCIQDGVRMLCKNPEAIRDYRRVILTPNIVEFKHLYEAVVSFWYFKKKCVNFIWRKPLIVFLYSPDSFDIFVEDRQSETVSAFYNLVISSHLRYISFITPGHTFNLIGVLSLSSIIVLTQCQ